LPGGLERVESLEIANHLVFAPWGDNGLYILKSDLVSDILIPENDKANQINFSLKQNYPNPFNPSTVISYQLPVIGMVLLKVYDLLGREIATLVNEEKPAGEYEVEFNAARLPSGIYFYQLRTGNFSETKKMVLIR